MKIEFTIEGPPPVDVVIERDSFTGKFTCTANGQVYMIKNPLNPATHFSLKLKKFYTFEIGPPGGSHLIEIEHTRPLFLAASRPHEYAVSVDGKLVTDHKG
jgi:hypothetical protein